MKSKNNNSNYLLQFAVFVIALEAILFSLGNIKLNEQARVEEERIENIQKNLDATPVLAKAVSVYDMSLGEKIYGKNDDIALPIASLTKIMTVVVGLNASGPDATVSITPAAISQAGDYGLFPHEEWNINDLAKFTLVTSANDGAYALFENKPDDFLSTMNSKAQKLGMKQTTFFNPTGLDIDGAAVGAVSSAEDVNTMAMFGFKERQSIFSATVLPAITLQSKSGFNHTFENTDTIIANIPNLLFSKTGYTELAGGNLTIIFQDKRGEDIAVTVLGSTYDGRFSDMEKIVNLLYNS